MFDFREADGEGLDGAEAEDVLDRFEPLCPGGFHGFLMEDRTVERTRLLLKRAVCAIVAR